MEKQAGDDQQHIASGGASLVAGLSSDIMGGIACATGRGDSGRSGSVVSDSGATSTPPRQSSKRDSGYHTDCSPATFSPLTPQFTFDTSGESPGERPACSPGQAFPGPSLSPGGPHKSRLPCDSGDEDENRTELVTTGNKPTGVPDIKLFQAKVDLGTVATRRKTTASPLLSEDDADDKCDIRCVGAAARLGSVQEEKEEREEVSVYKVGETESVYNSGETKSQETGSFMGAPGAAAQRRCRLFSRSDFSHGGGPSPARSDIKLDDDNDDDVFGDDEKGTGVACIAYHHAALSAIRLPGGDRFRPLLARSIATQTPHVHCQLIDQILACPQPLPACARGKSHSTSLLRRGLSSFFFCLSLSLVFLTATNITYSCMSSLYFNGAFSSISTNLAASYKHYSRARRIYIYHSSGQTSHPRLGYHPNANHL